MLSIAMLNINPQVNPRDNNVDDKSPKCMLQTLVAKQREWKEMNYQGMFTRNQIQPVTDIRPVIAYHCVNGDRLNNRLNECNQILFSNTK